VFLYRVDFIWSCRPASSAENERGGGEVARWGVERLISAADTGICARGTLVSSRVFDICQSQLNNFKIKFVILILFLAYLNNDKKRNIYKFGLFAL